MTPAAHTSVTDAYGRVTLSAEFANARVVVEVVGATEVRVRKIEDLPPEEVVFVEELPRAPLSDRDRDLLIALLDNPPEPSQALRDLMAGVEKRHG